MKFEVRFILEVDETSSRLSLGFDDALEEVTEAVVNSLYDLDDMNPTNIEVEEMDD